VRARDLGTGERHVDPGLFACLLTCVVLMGMNAGEIRAMS